MSTTMIEVYAELEGESREDGQVFVVSKHVPFFSAIVEDSEDGWDRAIEILRAHLEKNIGPVTGLRKVPEASVFMTADKETAMPPAFVPPAHIIAEVAR